MSRPARPARVSATLTDRYQTTVPTTVRDILGLKKRDTIYFTIEGDRVVLSRADQQEEDDDPAIGEFLKFLEKDIKANPQRIRPIPSELIERIESLTANVEIDMDEPLPSEDE
jgi:antitoxin PrlF